MSIVPGMKAIADDYASKCKQRGINATVKAHERVISFTLRYKGGEERSFVVFPDDSQNYRVAFEEHFPNDDGKRYKSAPMHWYDERTWSDFKFTARLENTIEGFVFYADRFGGI